MSLASVLFLLLVLPNGSPVAHLRNAEPGYLEARAAETVRAARVTGLDVAFLASVFAAESHYDRDAVSWNGSSAGLPQIRVGSALWKQWQTACFHAPSECQFAGQLVAARYLADALRRARGNRVMAVVIYRFGHVTKPRPRDRAVVRLAGKIAWLMKRSEVLR